MKKPKPEKLSRESSACLFGHDLTEFYQYYPFLQGAINCLSREVECWKTDEAQKDKDSTTPEDT